MPILQALRVISRDRSCDISITSTGRVISEADAHSARPRPPKRRSSGAAETQRRAAVTACGSILRADRFRTGKAARRPAPPLTRLREPRARRAAGHVRQAGVRPAPPGCCAQPPPTACAEIPGARCATLTVSLSQRWRADHASQRADAPTRTSAKQTCSVALAACKLL